jgi:hypothetical protein
MRFLASPEGMPTAPAPSTSLAHASTSTSFGIHEAIAGKTLQTDTFRRAMEPHRGEPEPCPAALSAAPHPIRRAR